MCWVPHKPTHKHTHTHSTYTRHVSPDHYHYPSKYIWPEEPGTLSLLLSLVMWFFSLTFFTLYLLPITLLPHPACRHTLCTKERERGCPWILLNWHLWESLFYCPIHRWYISMHTHSDNPLTSSLSLPALYLLSSISITFSSVCFVLSLCLPGICFTDKSPSYIIPHWFTATGIDLKQPCSLVQKSHFCLWDCLWRNAPCCPSTHTQIHFMNHLLVLLKCLQSQCIALKWNGCIKEEQYIISVNILTFKFEWANK